MPFLSVGLAGTCVVLLFWPTAKSIVQTWLVSETFTHGFFVIPVFLWLMWRKRVTLTTLPVSPDLRPLIFIACSGALWLLSTLAGIQVGEQLALAIILVCTLWAVLGRYIARELMFPLLFLLFLAPVGDELVPVLMEITADMTVWAIRNTGIPIYREGLFFSLPSGHWSVVEACSGIRYLIASSVLGSLFAYLTYTSFKLRLVFFTICLLIPILANSIRAYMIVMLGHFSSNKLATGVDHLVYGWLFFGVVMFALFSVGSWLQRFDKQDNHASTTDPDADRQKTDVTSAADTSQRKGSYPVAMMVVFMVVACWPIWSLAISANATLADAGKIHNLQWPEGKLVDATVQAPTALQWQPYNTGHDQRLEAVYEHEKWPPVRAMAFVYTHQRQGKEMINSGNVLVRSRNDIWRQVHSLSQHITLDNGRSLNIRQIQIRANDQRRTIWQWYRIGDEATSSPLMAKLLEVKARLLLRHSPSVNYMLIVDSNADNHDAALLSVLSRMTQL